ncbi:hypothetical protein Syun_023906 [Stephania yunnanensis]|uniref:F-box domain-containing protein n=1 Tax=Stephania yunnanensis TaxID=152371 RepID=A0AAP0I3Q1_9MAGN
MVDSSKNIDESSVVLRGNIDEELIVHNILPRLPINKIFQFKLVCKNWRDLISQDSFSAIYNSVSNPMNCYCHSSSSFYYLFDVNRVISSDDDGQNRFKLPQHLGVFLKGIPSIRGSTNGLIYGLCFHGAGEEIFVCNPITKQVVYVDKPKDLCTLALAYDPHNANGFGGFKIVGVFSYIDRGEKRYWFEVYSSKTGEWRALNAPKLKAPPPSFGFSLLSSFGFSGESSSAYNKGKVYYSYMENIIWFDVENEISGIVPCSDIEGNHLFVYLPTLGVCHEDGNGGEISYSRVTVEGVVKIWLLKNVGGGDEFEWVIRHDVGLPVVSRFNLDNLPNMNSGSCGSRTAKAFFPLPYLGGEVLWFRVLHGIHRGSLFSINTRSQELNYHDLKCNSVWPFIPTLLSCSS